MCKKVEQAAIQVERGLGKDVKDKILQLPFFCPCESGCVHDRSQCPFPTRSV